MSKKTKVRDMLIDGKPFKQINIENEKGKSTKFKPIGEGIQIGMHIVAGRVEENHLDIYQDGKDIGKNRNYKPGIAGVVIHHFGKANSELSILPQLTTTNSEWNNLSDIEKLHEYERRVKFIKKNK
jgi:hypothetical protein